jgi:hypothetical protein
MYRRVGSSHPPALRFELATLLPNGHRPQHVVMLTRLAVARGEDDVGGPPERGYTSDDHIDRTVTYIDLICDIPERVHDVRTWTARRRNSDQRRTTRAQRSVISPCEFICAPSGS